MQATRRARLEALIQEELSVVVPREVKDPRVPGLTFTAVTLTEEADQATVFIALFGQTDPDPQKVKECLAGLQSASGFLRRHLGKVLTVRHIPALVFREDKGFRNSERVHELLKVIDTETKSEKK